MNNDKQTECQRYDARARSILVAGLSAAGSGHVFGALANPPIYRAPYIYYEACLNQLVSSDHDVLELGAGTGLHTHALVQTGARVVASDISGNSLEVLGQRIRGRLTTRVADMESLPFEADSFDVVASAGSLSYADPALVDAEVRRVLRPGGIFICVDSLNHNPVYKFNRWVNYKRGQRTRSTILHMPTMGRIQSISRGFKSVEVRYFGSVSYLMPLLAKVIGQDRAAHFSDYVDRVIQVRRSAFKFVVVAKGRS